MAKLLAFPEDELALIEAYRWLPPAHEVPYVRTNMIASLDGATALDGRTARLGHPSDKRLFRVLRAISDVVLVGANTVRVEHYGPVRFSSELQSLRGTLGLMTIPPIAVVSASCLFDLESSFFKEAKTRPIVITSEHGDQKQLERVSEKADIIIAGDKSVSMAAAMQELAKRGFRMILAEGGPTLNAALLRAKCLDELCLTITPVIAANDSKPIFGAGALTVNERFELLQLLEDDGLLFLRHRLTYS